MMFFCPCMELISLISCVTESLEFAAMVVLDGGRISSFKYLGTAACKVDSTGKGCGSDRGGGGGGGGGEVADIEDRY